MNQTKAQAQARFMEIDSELHDIINDVKNSFECEFPRRDRYSVQTGTLISSLLDLNSDANAKAKQELLSRYSDAIGGSSEVSISIL